MPATPAGPPRSAPRLFVTARLEAGATIALEGPQAHYLARVMRVGEGAAIVLCDDLTGEWAARAVEVGRRAVALEVGERRRPREQVPDFWLVPALLKKDRFDLVLEKATELGVRAIHPVITRRCVADRLNPERARAIVTGAAEQCARTALPELAAPRSLAELLADWPAERALFFADELGPDTGAAPARQAFLQPDARHGGVHPAPAALLVGPEGGFEQGEREAIRALPQARPVALGPRILRGETAAIAGTALWMGICGDWAPDRA